MIVIRLILVVVCISLAGGSASAQTDVPDALKNRPPVAAPTSQIAVAPIEVVRSMSELINDYGGGLLQGLMAGSRVRNAVLIAAQDNRVIVTREFGCCVNLSALFDSDFLAPLAVLQLVEKQRIKIEGRVSDVVAGYGSTGMTIGDVLIHRADPSVLTRLVESASGQDFRSYVSQTMLSPLMSSGDGQTGTPSQAMGRLLVALLNGGAWEGVQVFSPETVELMRSNQRSIHPALPGWTYGFAEMKRNGRRALQRDGLWSGTPAIEARMVIVPEARVAYFVAVDGQAGASFWRVLDDALFDRILPPINAVAAESPPMPAPDATQARALAGSYEASNEPLSLAASLKSAGLRLVVRSADDGSLLLTGGENAVLKPQQGGYWASEGGNLTAVANDGHLILSNGIYRPLRWWKRPALYASFALLFALGAGGAFVGQRRSPRVLQALNRLVPVLAVAVAAFLALTLFVWHLSPAL